MSFCSHHTARGFSRPELDPIQRRESINVTNIPRELHTLLSETPYSRFAMQRAFVVRLGPKTEPSLGRFEGRVEEVDTGEELRFQSAEELLKFLGQRFDKALRRQRENR